jgi:hypothetical protein
MTWHLYIIIHQELSDLIIEEDRAHQILSRILRDDLKLTPERANAMASSMCSGILAAMTTPSKPGLQGWRIINSYPPFHDDKFRADVRKHIAADADGHFARELWRIVWDYGRDLPPDIAPPRGY